MKKKFKNYIYIYNIYAKTTMAEYHYYMLFISHFNVILMMNLLYVSCLLITLLL